jgi:urease accessory protein
LNCRTQEQPNKCLFRQVNVLESISLRLVVQIDTILAFRTNLHHQLHTSVYLCQSGKIGKPAAMSDAYQLELLALQLADSAFPSGSFAHSGGIEAAWKWGELGSRESLTIYLETVIRQLPYGTLPFFSAAYQQQRPFAEIDQLCHAVLNNHVARRASSKQGRALLATAARVFGSPALDQLLQQIKKQNLPSHLAPVFGAVTFQLGISLEKSLQIFLYTLLRDLVSAAVRLNIIGPHAGQQLLVELVPELQIAVRRSADVELDEIAQTAPIVEILQVNHDRLYSRLFQS